MFQIGISIGGAIEAKLMNVSFEKFIFLTLYVLFSQRISYFKKCLMTKSVFAGLSFYLYWP